MFRHFPLNRTQNHSADPARINRSDSDRPDGTHRRRSNLADPRFLGDGSDFIDKGKRVRKFLPTGLEYRALGRWGKLSRAPLGHPAGPVPEQNRVTQQAGTELPGIRNKVCPSDTPLVRLTLEQHEQSTHTRAHTYRHSP